MNRLRSRRKAAGLSVPELAGRLGVPQYYVYLYEADHPRFPRKHRAVFDSAYASMPPLNEPDFDTRAVAAELGIPEAHLFAYVTTGWCPWKSFALCREFVARLRTTLPPRATSPGSTANVQ